ncbi:conserved domain protein [delta proteobacterium NaphS2]|nr:conserved domain protein [delta proteobacterium NaphS2]
MMIGDLAAIMDITDTENNPTANTVITGTTSIRGTDMNIEAIGDHGTSGTRMSEAIPTYTSTGAITMIVPI